jgi:hypothetical protein
MERDQYQDALKPQRLLRFNRAELASYFKGVISQADAIDSVHTRLVKLVHEESLPPVVIEIWLQIAATAKVSLIGDGLRDSVSYAYRQAAIKTLG